MLYNIVFEVFFLVVPQKKSTFVADFQTDSTFRSTFRQCSGEEITVSGQSRIVFTKIELHDKKCKVDFCCISF